MKKASPQTGRVEVTSLRGFIYENAVRCPVGRRNYKKMLTKQKNGYIIGAIKSMACHEITSPIVFFTMGKLLYGGSSNEARYDFH
jgi:hypothetical protein